MKKLKYALSFCCAMIGGIVPFTASSQITEESSGTLRFYLVRHGQTYSNIKEMTVGGGGNAQLTAKGRYDATSLGLGLADVKFIAGYSSTLGRAYETANHILRGRNLPVTQIEDLKDISWGDAEGGLIEGLVEKFGHSGNNFPFYFGRYDDASFQSPVNAENMYHFSVRFENALRKIAKEQQGKSGNILVAAHSSMAFYLHKYRPDQPLTGLSNTSTSILEFKNNQFSLLDYNNSKYLTDGQQKYQSHAPLEITVVINPMTIFNRVGVMEGTSDSDLTEAGIAANQKLQQFIANNHYVAAYSSELGRADKTAKQVLANKAIKLQHNAALNEIFLGTWEAEKKDHLATRDPEQAKHLFSADRVIRFVSPVGGESGEIAAARLNHLLSKIGYQYEMSSQPVIVFTHPLIFTAFLNKAMPNYSFKASNTLQAITLQYKNESFTIKAIRNF